MDQIVKLAEMVRYEASGGESEGPRERAKNGDRIPLPRWHEVTVVAQDPSVADPEPLEADKSILRAQVHVPADRIWPGPQTHRFHVVDYDASANADSPPADFAARDPKRSRHFRWHFRDDFAQAPDEVLTTSRTFFAQNVYAIAARTLFAFEFALGRRIPWAFGSHQLYLIPHAFEMPNAFYSRESHAIFFGYLKEKAVETCLSHDIVAHETTHAVLDGLRARFFQPGYPDQAALHEGLADIVALLSVFSMPRVVERCLTLVSPGEVDLSTRATLDAVPKSALAKMAEQFGAAASDGHAQSLRASVDLEPFTDWQYKEEWREPHRRGEILVAIVMQTLLDMWRDRITRLVGERTTVALVAEEGTKCAEHLLRMIIRAIDYCPPAEFEFADLLEAILVSDAELAPDDEHGYRPKIRAAFNGFGIKRPKGQIESLSKKPPSYNNVNFGEFLSDADEVQRFVWQNAEALNISRDYYTHVEDVQPSVRIGPDGLILRESIACYIQAVEGTAEDLYRASKRELQIPTGLPSDTTIELYGGGVLIFDQFGRPKYHLRKRVDDWPRQSARLKRMSELSEGEAAGAIKLHGMVPSPRRSEW